MLKYFYKTILVSILSFSLMILNFTYNFSDLGNFGLRVNVNSAQATESGETLTSDGVYDTDYASALAMIVVAIVVVRLAECKWTLDMWAVVGAGIIFLAGEVTSFFRIKERTEELKTEINRDQNGKVEQKQIEALQALKKSYQNAEDIALFKRDLQYTAAGAFGLAAITAGSLAFMETTAAAACRGSLAAVATACAATCATMTAAVVTSPAAPLLCAGGIAAGALAGTMTAQTVAANIPAPSAAKASADTAADTANTSTLGTAAVGCPVAAAAIPTCAAEASLKFTTRGVCLVPPVASIPGIIQNQFYAKSSPLFTPIKKPEGLSAFIKNIFISEAKADLFTSTIGITAAPVIALLTWTSMTIGTWIDTFLFSPTNRAILWTSLAGIGYSAATSTQNQIDKIRANITKIDEVLKPLESLKDGITVNPGSGTDSTSKGSNKGIELSRDPDIDLSKDGKGALPCISKASATGKCPSFREQFTDLTIMNSMPEFVQNQLKDLTKIADGLNGKSRISGATLDQVNSFAGRRKAIRNELKKLQTILQKKLKENGSKVNVTEETKKLETNLKNIIQKELIKQKSSAQDLMASLGGSLLPKEKTKTPGSGAISKYTPPVIATPSSGMFEDLKNEKATAEAPAAPGEPANKAAALDDFELKNSDISTNKETSIFEVISNRYNKSYDRLFKKIK